MKAVYDEWLWPTPTVHGNDNRAGISPKAGDGIATAVKAEHPELARVGYLNPDWVETLMGFPPGWTECRGPRRAVRRSTRGNPRGS